MFHGNRIIFKTCILTYKALSLSVQLEYLHSRLTPARQARQLSPFVPRCKNNVVSRSLFCTNYVELPP